MTKLNIEQRLARLEQKAGIVEEVKEFPQDDDGFYYIDCAGDVDWHIWSGDKADQKLLSQGNIYRTREEAQIISDNRKTFVKLESMTNGFVPDWSDEKQGRWYIGWHFDNDEIRINMHYFISAGAFPYFATEQDAIAAAEAVGDDAIKQLREFGLI